MPRASSRSIHSPDSRVSRPATKRTGTAGLSCRRARTSAAPSRRTVGGSSGYSPALPRTPSVPNSRATTCPFSPAPGSGLQARGFVNCALCIWLRSNDSFTSVTVTRTLRVEGTRTVGSTTPTVATSVTVSVALAIDTGSVIASVSPRTADAGPAITTVGGSLVIAPMRMPSAGSPSMRGATITIFVSVGSNVIATLVGCTCTISTLNGARTSVASRWKRREPARACRRSMTASRSPALSRPRAADAPRIRTSTASGASPIGSSRGGRLVNSSGIRMVRSTVRSPATIIHRPVASSADTSSRPAFRGWISRIRQRCSVRRRRAAPSVGGGRRAARRAAVSTCRA